MQLVRLLRVIQKVALFYLSRSLKERRFTNRYAHHEAKKKWCKNCAVLECYKSVRVLQEQDRYSNTESMPGVILSHYKKQWYWFSTTSYCKYAFHETIETTLNTKRFRNEKESSVHSRRTSHNKRACKTLSCKLLIVWNID